MDKRTLIDDLLNSMNKLRDYIMADEFGDDDVDNGVDGDWLLTQLDNAHVLIELMLPEAREEYTVYDAIKVMSEDKLAIYLHSWQSEKQSVEDIKKLLESKADIEI